MSYSKVKICKICDGEGKITRDVGTHNSDYVTEKCTNCKGSGKIVVCKYSFTLPFSAKDNKHYYEADTKIFDVIRNLEKKIKK